MRPLGSLFRIGHQHLVVLKTVKSIKKSLAAHCRIFIVKSSRMICDRNRLVCQIEVYRLFKFPACQQGLMKNVIDADGSCIDDTVGASPIAITRRR